MSEAGRRGWTARWRGQGSILESLLLAILITGLNAVKDLRVDDVCFFYYARHLSDDPLNPYGFQVVWHQSPDTAQNPIAPPFVPYWWAIALKLFGDSQFWWRMWFLPVNFLLVASAQEILRRFAPRLARPLLVDCHPFAEHPAEHQLDARCPRTGIRSDQPRVVPARRRSGLVA